MCGTSEAKLNGQDINLFIGDRGGNMDVGGHEYVHHRGFAPTGRDKVRVFLLRHRKADIVDMVLELVENAEEA